MAAPPIVAAGEKFDLDTLLIDTVDERDYEDGGPASFIDMRAFEIYTQAPRGGMATAIQIWEGAAQVSSPYGAEHFFPDLDSLNETIRSGALSFLSWFYTFMEVWGKVCLFFISTYLAYQVLSWVGAWFAASLPFVQPVTPACTSSTCAALPSATSSVNQATL